MITREFIPRDDYDVVKNPVSTTSVFRYMVASHFIPHNSTVLDVGCGSGVGIKIVEAIRSIDWKACDYYQNKNNEFYECKQFFKKDFTNPYERDEKFDTVIAMEVIEHIEKENMDTFISNLVKASNRQVLISTPNKYNAEDDDEFHHSLFTKHTLKTLLEGYFSEVEVYGILELQANVGEYKVFPSCFIRDGLTKKDKWKTLFARCIK